MNVLDPATRYREHLGSFGIAEPGDRVAPLRSLDFRDVRFFAYAGSDGLRLKAAVTPTGVVTPGGHAGDDWHGLLSAAPDAASAAERIAWLETDESTSHGLPYPSAVALAPEHRPAAGIDPAQWAFVTAPALRTCSDGGVTLTAWLLAGGARVPLRWTIAARPGAAAIIERTAASDLVLAQAGSAAQAAADAAARGRRLLTGSDDERWWALEHIGASGDRAAMRDVAALLADAGASSGVRLHAAGTLARLADPAAVTPLGGALRADAAPEVRRACAQALGRIGGAGAVQALSQAAPDEPDEIVRAEIAQALAGQRCE